MPSANKVTMNIENWHTIVSTLNKVIEKFFKKKERWI